MVKKCNTKETQMEMYVMYGVAIWEVWKAVRKPDEEVQPLINTGLRRRNGAMDLMMIKVAYS